MTDKKVIELYKNELEFLISQKANPFMLGFLVSNYSKGNFQDEDMIETRGYFSGLKVALECLNKYLAIQEEVGDETDNP